MKFVSRGGEKMKYALKSFGVNPTGFVCADFGCSTGGFTDCLLQYGAQRVYAVDTGYGVIDWKLRNDPRVVLMERTNAMHCLLPEKADLVSVDASWTRLEKIMPNILANLKPDGTIIFLIKPHYEAERHMIHKGKLQDEYVDGIVQKTVSSLEHFPVSVKRVIESPILGEKSKNREFLVFLGRTG